MKTPHLCPALWVALLSGLMLGLAPPCATGQEAVPDSAGREVRLYGRVLDAATGLPVFGALVRPTGDRPASVTDTAGVWVLELPEAEEYVVAVAQLGYRAALLTLPTTAPGEFTTVLLEADPIELEGLEVLVDRFEERRRFYMGRVTVLDQKRLMSAYAASLLDIVVANVPGSRFCPDRPDDLCVSVRGEPSSVGVCLDEEPVYRVATELERYSVADIHLIEVFGRTHVRIYTRRFVGKSATSRRPLDRISWGCRGVGA